MLGLCDAEAPAPRIFRLRDGVFEVNGAVFIVDVYFVGLSYAVDILEAKISLLEKLACEYSLEWFVYNPACMDDTVNAVFPAWENKGAIILHVVANYNEELALN